MNWDYFLKDLDKVPESLLGVAIVFLAVILYVRVFGLKSFAKMTGYDFAATIAIGSLMGTVVAGSPSIVFGSIILGIMFLVNWLLGVLRFHSGMIQKATDNSPMLLMRDGEFLRENMRKVKVTEDTLRAKLREANVIQTSQVLAVVLETTGDVSVLHSSDLELDDYLLEGVRT